MTPKYKRILLKLSGETLGGEEGSGFDYETIITLAENVISVHNLDVEVGIVIGGGNIFRGSKPCLLYTSPSPRDLSTSRMPSSA